MMKVNGYTIGSHRAFLNIRLVEGGIRATRGKEFSVSPKLSDRLDMWERQETGVSKKATQEDPGFM